MNKLALAALTISVLIAWVACTPTPQTEGEPTRVAAPTPNDALLADAAEYARQTGVDLDEAVRRLQLQPEFGELGAALERQEAETFAGLWIQHQPDFRLIVAFTQDGEGTLRPYLVDKPWAHLVELRTFTYSLAELQAAQERAMQVADALRIPIGGGISVTQNLVTVEVGNPELFLAEVRAAGLELPEPVQVVAIDPENLSETLRGQVETYRGPDGREIYFPKQPPVNVYMQALLEGMLILDQDGCLRVGSELILWHHDFSLQVAGEVIEVLNGERQVVARVGEELRMGGGETPGHTIPDLPLQACPGPYWALGEIE